MTHREAIALLDHPLLRGVTRGGAAFHWADLGCGAGTFTFALAEFLGPGSTIEAMDLTPGIRKQTTAGQVSIVPTAADITQPNPALQNLDGILIANVIHYIRDQPAFVQMLHATLKPGGILVLVEYDTDTPVPHWVPYPLSFPAAARLFTPPHWTPPQRGNTRPSAYGRGHLYTALTQKIDDK
jgi:SAM-dependent methyltransferase